MVTRVSCFAPASVPVADDDDDGLRGVAGIAVPSLVRSAIGGPERGTGAEQGRKKVGRCHAGWGGLLPHGSGSLV